MNQLSAVIGHIVAAVGASTNVVYSPNNPPTAISDDQLPAAVVYPSNGQSRPYSHSEPNLLEIATIRIDLHCKMVNPLDEVISQSVELQEPLSRGLWTAWFTHKFGGSVFMLGSGDGSVFPIRWNGPMRLDGYGQKTLGFRYEIDVSVQEAL